MYKTNNYNCVPQITHQETYEGELIETKVRRVTENKEPITDGAPIIFTDKKDGVLSGYDIRADKWDIALSAMDQVNKEKILKATEWMKKEAEEKATSTASGESGTPKDATESQLN